MPTDSNIAPKEPKKERDVWPALAFFHSTLIITLYILYKLAEVAFGIDDYIINRSSPVWMRISDLNTIISKLLCFTAASVPIGSLLLLVFPKWRLFKIMIAAELGCAVAVTYFVHEILRTLPA